MNVSGIVVKTLPSHIESLVNTLKESDLCNYHFHDESGKIIITIEGEDISEEIGKLAKIQKIEYVMSADMVYSYSEDELEKAMEKVCNGGSIPEILNRDIKNAQDIIYGGDVNSYIK